LDRRWIHFHAHVVQDVTPIERAGQCVEGYMEWFRLVSHPYIIQMPDHDRPMVVAPMRGADADDGQTHDDDTIICFYFQGIIRRMPETLQSLVDGGHVPEGTPVWDGIQTALMLGKGATNQTTVYVRHRRR